MHPAARSLIFLTAILAATGAALPELSPNHDTAPGDVLEWNQKLLERWRKDPEHAVHVARLHRDLERFWKLPAEERARIRQFDQELHEQDSTTQKRMWGVLERYHAWFERLSVSDRKRIESVSGQERVAVVREIKDRQYIERLPAPIRNRVEGLKGKEREDEVAHLREEQRERAQEVFRLQPPRVPKKDRPTRLSEFPRDVQLFVRNSLWPLLTAVERDNLKKCETEPWPAYARTLAHLASTHPIPLPGPIGPVRIADVPNPLGNHLKNSPRLNSLRREEGKWPEFGVALLALPQSKKFPLPARFTPSAPQQFAEMLQEFILALEKKLSPEERDKLLQAEGRWPEYPRLLLELSRKHKLEVPGMSLPGPKELWDGARAALPDVPERALLHFAMTEMSKEDREQLPLTSADPVIREKLKKDYFRKHPRELRRLQQLDSRGTTLDAGPK